MGNKVLYVRVVLSLVEVKGECVPLEIELVCISCGEDELDEEHHHEEEDDDGADGGVALLLFLARGLGRIVDLTHNILIGYE